MAEATIRDVARKAEVSVASVSRALSGAANVSAETKERIARAVSELGYIPHAGARSLSHGRTHAIGVVLPDLHGEFFSEIVRGMDREASANDYLLLLSPMHGGGRQATTALRAMRGRVDGLLLMAPHIAPEELRGALPANLPAVLINTRSSVGRTSIRLDNAAGMRAVVAHLLAQGKRHFVHLRGPAGNLDAQERADAITDALDAAGLRPIFMPGNFEESGGHAAIRQLVADGTRFDAVIAANDMMAIGALTALRQAGVEVPRTVAVTGFDDVPLARHLDLTTVRVRIADLGAEAIVRLLAELGGERPSEEQLHQPELVVRRTTEEPS
ncbi:LacI family transcriptional regulator [Sphingomonas ginkgonis]|uniref:LacI family transcriptional regulator n=1 Tax=Sphingomonas ginkgonis TaxID=2315330 RepID=A0A3R9YH58_9SPHN|nr:LacI family DNA-binding transcriptional regulator [Sphingomonas ginkgonis]RST29857.1 LacI family transcriptional regulator [Sphingomonas ginkgonis]